MLTRFLALGLTVSLILNLGCSAGSPTDVDDLDENALLSKATPSAFKYAIFTTLSSRCDYRVISTVFGDNEEASPTQNEIALRTIVEQGFGANTLTVLRQKLSATIDAIDSLVGCAASDIGTWKELLGSIRDYFRISHNTEFTNPKFAQRVEANLLSSASRSLGARVRRPGGTAQARLNNVFEGATQETSLAGRNAPIAQAYEKLQAELGGDCRILAAQGSGDSKLARVSLYVDTSDGGHFTTSEQLRCAKGFANTSVTSSEEGVAQTFDAHGIRTSSENLAQLFEPGAIWSIVTIAANANNAGYTLQPQTIDVDAVAANQPRLRSLLRSTANTLAAAPLAIPLVLILLIVAMDIALLLTLTSLRALNKTNTECPPSLERSLTILLGSVGVLAIGSTAVAPLLGFLLGLTALLAVLVYSEVQKLVHCRPPDLAPDDL